MAGGGEAGEPEHLLADHVHVLLGNRSQLSPEEVELILVESSRARLEAARVDDVRRPDLGDVHLEARVLTDEHTGCARMVEMDVRKEQVPEIRERQPSFIEPPFQLRDTRRGPAVLER